MIRRCSIFVTIVLLLAFPVLSLDAASKSEPKKKTGISAKKETKRTGARRAQYSNKTQKTSKTSNKRSKNVAREIPPASNHGSPLFKVTPLESGKFLIEPMESSRDGHQGLDSLSLIRKPIFEDGITGREELSDEEESLLGFQQLLVKFSKQLLGTAYRLGGYGQGNDGIDCSGFMKKIFHTVTLNLPHSSREQAKIGALVTTDWDLSRLRIGDLLFFKRNRGVQIGHTGMYIGDGKMIHSSSRKGVIITNLIDSQVLQPEFCNGSPVIYR